MLGVEQSGGRSASSCCSVLRDEDVIERARAAATDHVAADPALADATRAWPRRSRRSRTPSQAEYPGE